MTFAIQGQTSLSEDNLVKKSDIPTGDVATGGGGNPENPPRCGSRFKGKREKCRDKERNKREKKKMNERPPPGSSEK